MRERAHMVGWPDFYRGRHRCSFYCTAFRGSRQGGWVGRLLEPRVAEN